VAPGWPDDPETVEEARAHPEAFAGKKVGLVADHVGDLIGSWTRSRPSSVTRSAGCWRRSLRDGGCLRSTVAIDPAPFRGVLPLPISSLKVRLAGAREPANWNRAVTLSLEQFKYGWANAVSDDEAKQLYETFHVAASGAPLFQAATANLNPWTEAKVNSKRSDRGSLLLISGESDHTVPWAIVNASYKRQRQNSGVTDGRDDPEPRACAHDRQRLARGRRQGARVHPALRISA